MATEAPLVHDGSQTTASVNFGLNSGNLGPNGSGQFLAVKLVSGTNRQVALPSANGPVYGILQNTPSAGQAADVGIVGVTKAVAGAAVTGGGLLGVNASGQVINFASGSTIGWALEAATAANQIITIAIVPGMT